MIPYFSYIIYLIITKTKRTLLTFFLHFYLCLSSFLYNFSFYIPKVQNQDILCNIQSLLNIFSDLSGMSISSIIVLLGQMNFVNTENLKKRHRLYVIISIFFCWIIPLTFGVVSYFNSKRNDYSDFCWIYNEPMIITYFITRLLYYIVFYICIWRLKRYFNCIKDRLNNDFLRYYVNMIKKYIIVITISFLIYLVYVILDLIYIIGKKSINPYYWLIVGSFHCLSFPLIVIGFNFNKDVIKELLCKNKNEHIDIDTTFKTTLYNDREPTQDTSESQMEIITTSNSII